MIPILASVIAAPASSAAPYDFQGVVLGSTAAAFHVRYPDARCTTTEAQQECVREDVGLADERVRVYYSFDTAGPDGPLYKIAIIFPYRATEAVRSGLRGRWGAPKAIGNVSMWTRERYQIVMKDALPGDYSWVRIVDKVTEDRRRVAADREAARDF